MRPPAPFHAVAARELTSGREPVAVFESLRARPYPWLLESALRSPRLGRYSFAGADPRWVLRVRGARVEVEVRRGGWPAAPPGRRSYEGDVFDILRRLMPRLLGDAPAFPFVGGAVGYLGYELAESLEDLDLGGLDDIGAPDACLFLADRCVAWDHVEGRAAALALGCGADAAAARADAEAGVAELLGWLEAAPPERAHSGAAGGHDFDCFDEASYAKAVDAILEEIAAGNVYQANLSHRRELGFSGDPWDLYRALRRTNPAPFACYLELPELTVVGSSPERFLRVASDSAVESRPIKGTRPRGRDPGEDERLRAELAASAKDRAENLMIVDLVRNDLGRVCQIGSVAVPELMAIEEYAGVFQMVSSVSGRLRADCDAVDAVRAAFPPGSMTGAPKLAAMNLLSRLEPVRRGVYSGAVGWFDARGGCDLSVVIRTLLVRDGRVWLHAGGGIVADSDPRSEWRETLDKAQPLLNALAEVRRQGGRRHG